MDIIKVGIIGSGWVAEQRHIPAFKRIKNCIISAIYSLDKEKAEKLANQFSIPYVFNDLEAFLNSSIDCVTICTPPFTHAELIYASLLANKHVMVEKPMTMKEEEGEELEELALQKQLILMPVHNFLFCDSILKAKKIYESGRLGKILGVGGIQWSSWQRPLPKWYKDLPGGLFFDEAPHLIYLTQYFIGELSVEKVWHESKIINHQSLERWEVILKGKKGNGVLSIWLGAPISEWFFYVHGTEGTIIVDIFRDIMFFYSKEIKRTPLYLIETIVKDSLTAFKRFIKWGIARYIFKRKNLFGVDILAKNFIYSILGLEKPLLSPKDGWSVVEILNYIIQKKE